MIRRRAECANRLTMTRTTNASSVVADRMPIASGVFGALGVGLLVPGVVLTKQR